MDSTRKVKKSNPKVERIRRLKKLEKFIEEQLEEYVKIHKRHEKEISYIG